MNTGNKPTDFVHFQIERNVTNLFKRLLGVLDDVSVNHADMMEKIAKELPQEQLARLVDLDYFTANFAAHLRKKVLDAGNDSLREIKTVLEKIEIDFKH